MRRKTNKYRVFDTMGQAASVLSISKETLSDIKSKGCSAFRGSRVHEKELMDWIDAHGERGRTAPGSELIEAWEETSRAGVLFVCRVLMSKHPQKDLIAERIKAMNRIDKEVAIMIGARTEDDYEPAPEDE